jgi:hypothetical protein
MVGTKLRYKSIDAFTCSHMRRNHTRSDPSLGTNHETYIYYCNHQVCAWICNFTSWRVNQRRFYPYTCHLYQHINMNMSVWANVRWNKKLIIKCVYCVLNHTCSWRKSVVKSPNRMNVKRVYEKMEAEIGCNCESFILKTHISLRTIIV